MNRSIWWIGLAALLAACGGGGGSTTLSVSSPGVSGVAATGTGIQGTIYLRDRLFHERYFVTSDGHYSFDTTGLVSPFILKATWSNGELYSFSQGDGVANITPLTQAIVQSASAGADPAMIYTSADPAALDGIAAHLAEATDQCLNGLSPLLNRYSAVVDPITSRFSADHTGMDKLLDDVDVSFGGGLVTLKQKADGTLLFSAPGANLGRGLSNENWSPEEARVAEDPSVAVDPAGHGLVVWSQTDGTRYHIQSKWLSGSNPSARLSNDLGDAAVPKVAFDATGNAIAVWAQYDGARNTIWSNRYASGAGWGLPEQISSQSSGDAYYPDLGLDASGNAIAVWYEWDGVSHSNHFDVFSSRFTEASGTWSAPAMRSNGLKSAYRCRVAVAPDGKALLAWTQASSDGSVGNDTDMIVTQTYSPSTGWGSDQTVNSVHGSGQGSLSLYGQVAVALDGSGEGTVAWVQADQSGPFYIWAAQLSGSTWATATTISNGAVDNCYAPEVAYIGPGKAIVTWNQQGNNQAFTFANASTSGSWASTGTIISDGVDDCFYPHIAGDAQGNASVIWFQVNASEVSIHSNRYVQELGWSAPQLVGITGLSDADVSGALDLPVSAVGSNATGQSFVAWGIDPF